MKQLIQILKTGKMEIQEVPVPLLGKGMILVKNHFSLISTGTESSTVKTARKSLIGKAREKPQEFKLVLDTLKKIGSQQTYRAVMNKLDAYSPLGYSSAGEVIEVGDGITKFKVGDKVACAGSGYANHAEVVAIPNNLCVKLKDDADLKKAAYNTLGAIAMQGVRQADLRIGESCVVIGLGLIGQLTCLILKASGIKVYGIDVKNNPVEVANKNCVDKAWIRTTIGLSSQIKDLTNGYGSDSVIITASTSILDPINFSGEIVRKKGKVVVVGAVPTGFDRDKFYKKELDLRMSCSYGPGRYDPNYEEKGHDYPYNYVRWTENRNMEAFQELIYDRKIDIEYLTTHEFNFKDASIAYDMIIKGKETYFGIILGYDINKPVERKPLLINDFWSDAKINIGFIGAGSYAISHLLPNISVKADDINLVGVMTNNGTSSKRVAEKYKFKFCTSNQSDIFENENINTVFIATNHDTHAKYVLESLYNNKNVFVEKPLCLTKDELKEIKQAYNNKYQIMIGFNRRFAPLAIQLKNNLSNIPMAIIYRVNAGSITRDSWIQDFETGGGRIIGEVCHFIDFLIWMNGSLPKCVFANTMNDTQNLNDTLCINLKFTNGSIGTINYFANGSKSLTKEYIEIYQSGLIGVIKDFKELQIWGKVKNKKKLFNQDKGQKLMVRRFIDSIKTGQPAIPINEIFAVTDATLKVVESIYNNKCVDFN